MLCTISNGMNLLEKIRKDLPMHVHIIYFNANIQPLLDYTCNIWGSCYEKLNTNTIKVVPPLSLKSIWLL